MNPLSLVVLFTLSVLPARTASAASDFAGEWKSVKCIASDRGYCQPLRTVTFRIKGSGQNVEICADYDGVVRPGRKTAECYQFRTWNPSLRSYDPAKGFSWHNGGSTGYYRVRDDLELKVTSANKAELHITREEKDENRYSWKMETFLLERQ